jgi:hypothetical protein
MGVRAIVRWLAAGRRLGSRSIEARAFTEAYNGPELWQRRARLTPMVRQHEPPLETADYYVRHTLRVIHRRAAADQPGQCASLPAVHRVCRDVEFPVGRLAELGSHRLSVRLHGTLTSAVVHEAKWDELCGGPRRRGARETTCQAAVRLGVPVGRVLGRSWHRKAHLEFLRVNLATKRTEKPTLGCN